MSADPPTPRTTLQSGFAVLGWCKVGCGYQAFANLQRIIDRGGGDVPLTRLRFRCSNCGSAHTDWLVASKRAVAVRPWRGTRPKRI